MLKRRLLVYDDGRKEDYLVHYDYGEDGKLLNPEVAHVPMRKLKIKHAFNTTFKYRIKKHSLLPPTLVKLKGELHLMPEGIKVHPKATLKDVEIIEKKTRKKKTQDENTYTFKSSSSDSIYTVREMLGKYKCNCPGFFRSKGNCKHVKELKNKKE